MRELKLIRSEADRLIVATESGETYALAIDDALRSEVRSARPESRASAGSAAAGAAAPGGAAAGKAGPREIQSHIRAGLSAEEVAELLGIEVSHVERFEAPVLAERQHIVGLALAVPVLIGGIDDATSQPTFGDAIRAKLADAAAHGERWTSWKDQNGWTVKLDFTIGEVDHDARWSFDPRRSVLNPTNTDATQLSRQGSLPEGLIPRLRALDAPSVLKDEGRFDSGAFGPRGETDDDAQGEDEYETAEAPRLHTGPLADAAIKRAPETSVPSAETADLLEALRRRRGQREATPSMTSAPTTTRSAAPVALFEAVELSEADSAPETAAVLDASPSSPASATPAPAPARAGDEAARVDGRGDARRRGSRPALPSWDEIVFGARTDTD